MADRQVPAVVDQLSSRRVMTTAFVEGLTRLDRPSELAALGLPRAVLGELVGRAFTRLSLEHGLVHGDPHAGNVYARADPANGGAPQLVRRPAGTPRPDLGSNQTKPHRAP